MLRGVVVDVPNDKTRILIATAGFGEGHNSAAKGLKHVLGSDEVAQIVDPCMEAAPRTTERIQDAYRKMTVYSPYIWKKVYNACDKRDFTKERLPVMRKVRATMGRLIEEMEVEALLTTYFIYPYFMERHVRRQGKKVPVFTVVTDSIEINAAWFKAPCDHWFVADQFTRRKLIDFGLSPSVVHEFGFPIHPRFGALPSLSAQDALEEFRVLFFPTPNGSHTRNSVRAILRADERVKVTLVLGKNVRSLYRYAMEVKGEFPGRVRIIGWTRKVAELLTSHHLIIGKAGGATVHEAITANCPMLVHHIVPGQEEGNLALLRASQCGDFVRNVAEMTMAIQNLLAHNGALWRLQKENMRNVAKPDAAKAISEFVLDKIG